MNAQERNLARFLSSVAAGRAQRAQVEAEDRADQGERLAAARAHADQLTAERRAQTEALAQAAEDAFVQRTMATVHANRAARMAAVPKSTPAVVASRDANDPFAAERRLGIPVPNRPTRTSTFYPTPEGAPRG